jgi:2-polyprenyl-3-methyl-5-hydroxy-6-metoxy-1,4-benzoquinol methylase
MAKDAATCLGCAACYPFVGPVLDLRVPGASWIDLEQDRANAFDVLAAGDVPAAALIERVFSRRCGWSKEHAERRVSQLVEGTRRMRGELHGWLAPLQTQGPILDLGCGGGQLLAALASDGRECVGVDVSLEWLVVAHRLVAEHASPRLVVAAMAEALPFPDATFAAVASLDVLEHVGDQSHYLREIDRVLLPGGFVALATPNRFSLAAEPHVGVWGVGWLPRSRQKGFVQRRTPISYDYVRLVSYAELKRLVRRNTSWAISIRVPPIPPEELERMAPRRSLLAKVFNALVGWRVAQWAFRAVGPFFRITGRKRG